MSEPMSAVEIEDVLSSIRRLVSEDMRPQQRGFAAAGPDPAKPALILTPALRVVPEPQPAREASAARKDQPAPEPIAPSAPIGDVIAAVGAAVVAHRADWEPETGEDAPGSGITRDVTMWDPLPEDDAMPLDELVREDDPLPEDDLVREGDLVPEDDPLPEAVIAPGRGLDGDELVERAIGEEAAHAPGWAQAGGEEVASFEAAAERDMPPPADAGWVAQAEAEVIAGLEHREPVDTFQFVQSRPEMTFDEEVLRDLVRDLIREELQGHLGERITRNIRKLVRAEIARALAAAEFD